MGTSVSSKGPGSRISLDPPWLQPENPHEEEQPPLAPPMRFAGARRGLTEYIRSGNRDSLGKSLGHYSRTGMGGAHRVAQRMKATAGSASRIFNFFQEVRASTDESLRAWVESLKQERVSTNDLINHFVEKVLPLKGTLDEESCRKSMDMALTELIDENPTIDLFQLNDNDIWQLVRLFVQQEAYQRLNTDLGKKFEEVQISPMEMVTRQSAMKEYLRSELDAQITKARELEQGQHGANVDRIILIAIENTFSVFEEML